MPLADDPGLAAGSRIPAGRSDTLFPESALDRMIDLMERGGDVFVVLSNPGSIGNGGSRTLQRRAAAGSGQALEGQRSEAQWTLSIPSPRYAIRKGRTR